MGKVRLPRRFQVPESIWGRPLPVLGASLGLARPNIPDNLIHSMRRRRSATLAGAPLKKWLVLVQHRLDTGETAGLKQPASRFSQQPAYS